MWILQQILPVGANVEHHRDDTTRIDSSRCSIDRQLADRNFHATYAPIADAQNLLGVGSKDQVDVARAATVGKRFLDASA